MYGAGGLHVWKWNCTHNKCIALLLFLSLCVLLGSFMLMRYRNRGCDSMYLERSVEACVDVSRRV